MLSKIGAIEDSLPLETRPLRLRSVFGMARGFS
jgi:hypothetical protein